jgi:hypothetical protein
MAVPQDSDWSWLRAAAEAPEMTLELYEEIPDDLARQIEVSDGTIIVCHSPSDKHLAVQHALLNAIAEAARKHGQRKGTCYRSELTLTFCSARCRSTSAARTWRSSGVSTTRAGEGGKASQPPPTH